MQHLVPKTLRCPAYRWLAVVCCWLVVVAGTLAANSAWHDALFHGGADSVCPADGATDTRDAGHAPEADCAICAFAQHQVATDWVMPICVVAPVRQLLVEKGEPSDVLCPRVWPEPSGRGPPCGV